MVRDKPRVQLHQREDYLPTHQNPAIRQREAHQMHERIRRSVWLHTSTIARFQKPRHTERRLD
jgi:hypothetical protein